MQVIKAGFGFLITSFLTACTSSVTSTPYSQYLQQTTPGASTPGAFNDPVREPRLQPFLRMFTTLSEDAVKSNIEQVYADELYFNDTFHTFTDLSEVREYFLSLTGVAETRVTPLDYASADQDIWLRWKMTTKAKILWKDVEVESIGMTHLRFNDQNQIIMHQDYWDSTEGFFIHIPLLGGMIESIRSNLGETK